MTAPGYAEQQKLLEAGFTPTQVAAWRQQRIDKFQAAGFSEQQIQSYFGEGPLNYDAASSVQLPEGQTAQGFLQALQAGYQQSVSGLAQRGRLPDLSISPDANFVEIVGAAVGQGLGDLPVSLPAFGAGAARFAPVGAAAGGAVTRSPLAAGAAGAVAGFIGGEATSGFVTDATRQSLINFYEDNENRGKPASARDFASRYMAAILNQKTLEVGGQGAAIGAAVGATGGVARLAAPALRNPAVREAVVPAAEVGAAVAAAAVLEGELPDAQDFAAGAAVVLGFEAGSRAFSAGRKALKDAQGRMMDHYAATGERPELVTAKAAEDRIVQQQIVTGADREAPGAVRMTVAGKSWDGAPVGDKIHIDRRNASAEGVEAARAAPTAHSAIVAATRPTAMSSSPADPAAVSPGATSVEAARAAIRAKIRPVHAGGKKASLKERIDDFRYRYVNDLQYVVSASETAYMDATGTRLSVEENPGELMRLAYGAHAIAEMEIKDGIYDASGKKVMFSLEDLLSPVADRYDEFVAYMVSRRAVEKAEQGFETPFDFLDADLVAKDGDADAKFTAARDNFQAWTNAGLRKAVGGVLSKEGYDKIVEQNRDFVPFARALADPGSQTAGVTVRGLPVRKPVRKFTGGEGDILDPFEVAVKNRYALEQIIANNAARQRLVEFNADLPEGAQFLKKVSGKQTTVIELAKTDTELKTFLEQNGMDIEDVEGIHLYRAMSRRLSKNEFIVFYDGKPEVYKADDPNLVKSLMSLDDRTQSLVGKFLQKAAVIQRGGVVLNPEFTLKAGLRDQLQAFIQNPFAVTPFLTTLEGLAAISRKDAAIRRWITFGGANSSLLSLDKTELGKELRDRIRKPASEDLLTMNFWWNQALTPIRAMQTFSLLMENATRVGRFIKAEKEGLSKETAALQSRDIALDFSRMGADIRAYNMITNWIGASINGIDRFHTAFTRDPVGTSVKTFAAITLPSLLLWFVNKDQEWYKDLPAWRKSMFWNINTGLKDEAGEPIIFAYPMPHQFGTLFGSLPVAMLEEAEKTDPDVVKEIGEGLLQTYNIPLLPSAVTPLVEIGLNHNFYTDSAIVSSSQERLLPEYRYSPYTTSTAKQAAKVLNSFAAGTRAGERYRTPIAIEHMVRGYAGSIGTELLRQLDKGLQKAGVVPAMTNPSEQLADDPVYGTFFVRHSGASEQIATFYDRAERIEQTLASLREEMVRNPEEAERIEDRIADMALLETSATKQALSNLRKAAYAVHYDPDMEPFEKRQLITDILEETSAIAQAWNEAYDGVREEMAQ